MATQNTQSSYDVVAAEYAERMFIDHARKLSPEIRFEHGDMLSLDIPDNSIGGIAAFYSIIHIQKERLSDCLNEFRRILSPKGILLVAFHIGDHTTHLDEWWGYKVSVDFNFFQTNEVKEQMQSAGFSIIDSLERDPYAPAVEHQSRRSYIFAQK